MLWSWSLKKLTFLWTELLKSFKASGSSIWPSLPTSTSQESKHDPKNMFLLTRETRSDELAVPGWPGRCLYSAPGAPGVSYQPNENHSGHISAGAKAGSSSKNRSPPKSVLWWDESKFDILVVNLERRVLWATEKRDIPACYQWSV